MFHFPWSFNHVWKLFLNLLLMTPCGNDADGGDDGYQCLDGDLEELPFSPPSYTWQLYVYVPSSAADTPSRQQSQYAPDIWNWGRQIHQKEVGWGLRSIIHTLMLQDVCNIVVCPNWGHEWAVNKEFDSVPHEMEVEVKPFFSLFKSGGYSALIGCAW